MFYSYLCVVVTLTPTYQTDIRDVLYVGEELTLIRAVSGETPALFLLGTLFDDISTTDDDANKKDQGARVFLKVGVCLTPSNY